MIWRAAASKKVCGKKWAEKSPAKTGLFKTVEGV